MIKRLLCLLLVTCSVLSLSAQTKIITYNIWNGFGWGKDSIRKEQCLNWIENQHPDIVALQELCGYSDDKLSKDAKEWGHNYSVLLKDKDYSVGLTSKYPIVLKERIMEGMHHGALHCETNGIEMFVVHLSPFKWKTRLEEADILMPKIVAEIDSGNRVVVCGDFNAFSPVDFEFYKDKEMLLEQLIEDDIKYDYIENLNSEEFCFSAISRFLGFNLYDVTALYTTSMADRISCPTTVFADNDEEKEILIKKGTRLDYILTSYNMIRECVSADVKNGEETSRLSDHYPVIAIFK